MVSLVINSNDEIRQVCLSRKDMVISGSRSSKLIMQLDETTNQNFKNW